MTHQSCAFIGLAAHQAAVTGFCHARSIWLLNSMILIATRQHEVACELCCRRLNMTLNVIEHVVYTYWTSFDHAELKIVMRQNVPLQLCQQCMVQRLLQAV